MTTDALIDLATNGNHGLAPRRWRAQLAEIRALPEAER